MSSTSIFLSLLVPGVYLTRLPKSKRDKKTPRETRQIVDPPFFDNEWRSFRVRVKDGSGRIGILSFGWTSCRIAGDETWEMMNIAGDVVARYRITPTPDGEHPKEDRYSWLK